MKGLQTMLCGVMPRFPFQTTNDSTKFISELRIESLAYCHAAIQTISNQSISNKQFKVVQR